jgi:hypothetical protein
MDEREHALKFYEAARQESLLRIRLRDQIIVIYLAATGTILGVSLHPPLSGEFLLVVPFLAVGAAILLAQHNLAIGYLGRFCANEIGDVLRTINFSRNIPQWDDSQIFKSYSKTSSKLRTWGQSLIIIIPCILSLSVNFKHAMKSPIIFIVLWWFGAVSVVAIITIAVATHLRRIKQYKDRWSVKSDSGKQPPQ